MSVKTEPKRLDDVLLSESEMARYSREKVTVASGQSLTVGAVIGETVTAGATAAGAAGGGNTGDGTISGVSAAAGAQQGAYRAVITEPAADGGTFQVEDPEGRVIGTGVVGSEFSNQVVFTLNDGAADFVAGDQFTITVDLEGATRKVKEYDPDGTDGTERVKGIIGATVDASAADVDSFAIVRDAIMKTTGLAWKDGLTDAQKEQAIAELKELGIVARDDA